MLNNNGNFYFIWLCVWSPNLSIQKNCTPLTKMDGDPWPTVWTKQKKHEEASGKKTHFIRILQRFIRKEGKESKENSLSLLHIPLHTTKRDLCI